ncbi:hypothetical protein [Paracidobacterium acidisoli]|uniref:Uncharacterized protein n=1 Tax=Paracidobacterium acidisoli TaxID=2303751 RepID=A0A372IQ56_9BACT|nr:hypothetical protein [Paracidobacterium acidisoli]MBT9331348.1 hypothetical protein [Paracidobacterium acidisoli]
MAAEAVKKSRKGRLGIYLAAGYIVLVVAVYILTAATTKPSNVGLDWIPFVMLAFPWYQMDIHLLLSGFVINAGILYLIGTLAGTLWREMRKSKSA